MSLRDDIEQTLLRIATTGIVPSSWFLKPPARESLPARSGTLDIEIVSHCWRYAHLLAYQLSSLVNFPPTKARVRMTVFHASEDEATRRMLEFFGGIPVPGVAWNWQVLTPPELFRRSIGRNRIARATTADWVWFTDCDIVFHRDCIDTLSDRLQARQDRCHRLNAGGCSAARQLGVVDQHRSGASRRRLLQQQHLPAQRGLQLLCPGAAIMKGVGWRGY